MKLFLSKYFVVCFLMCTSKLSMAQTPDSLKDYGKCTVKFPYLSSDFKLKNASHFKMYWNTYDSLSEQILENSIVVVEVYNCHAEIQKDSLIGVKRAKSVIGYIAKNYGFSREDFYINENFIGKWEFCKGLSERIAIYFR